MQKRLVMISSVLLLAALLCGVAAAVCIGSTAEVPQEYGVSDAVKKVDDDYLWSSQILKDGGIKVESADILIDNYMSTPEQREKIADHVISMKASWRNGGTVTLRTPKEYVPKLLGFPSDKYNEYKDSGKLQELWSEHIAYIWDAYEEALGRDFIEYRRGAGDRYSNRFVSNSFADGLVFAEGGTGRDYNEVKISYQGLFGLNTSIEQEIAVREYVEKLFAPGGSMYEYRADNDRVSDLEKYKAVYRFTKTIHYNGKTYSSLYSAFFGSGIACDGFSTLTVLISHYCGLNTVMVVGSLIPTPHAWNWVKIGNYYYNTDNTDSINDNKGDNGWVLSGMKELDGSTNKFFLSYEDMDKYIVPEAAVKFPRADYDWRVSFSQGNYIDAGYINRSDGERLRWVLEDGVLTVTGNGEMSDFGNESDVPWRTCAEYIKDVKIADTVTSIGANAFAACPNVTYESVKDGLPEGIKVGKNAFSDLAGDESERTAYISLNDGYGIDYKGRPLNMSELVALAAYGGTAATAADVTFRHREAGSGEEWKDGAPENAGTWEVQGTIKEKTINGVHYASYTDEARIILHPATVYIIGLYLKDTSKVYDGTDTCEITGVSLNTAQIPSGASRPVFGVDFTLRGKYADKNVSYNDAGNITLKGVYAADIVMLDTQIGRNYIITTSGAPYDNAKIMPATLTAGLFDKIPVQQYTGKAVTPDVQIAEEAKQLINSDEYTVTYRNNTQAGTAYADITAKDRTNYTGTVTLEFEISNSAPAEKEPTLELNNIDRMYNGRAVTREDMVKAMSYGGADVREEDITVQYRQLNGVYYDGLPKEAGQYEVQITLRRRVVDGVQYKEVKKTASVNITKAPLTVSVKTVTMSYGTEVPYYTFSASYEGLAEGDTDFNVIYSGSWIFDYSSYTKGSPVGEYDIKPYGVTSLNYELTIVPGKLIVEPLTVILDWQNVTGRVAGDGLTVTAKAGGLFSGDVIGVTVQGGDASSAGTHTATAVALTGDKARNYKLPREASVTYEIERQSGASGIYADAESEYTYGGMISAAVTADATSGKVALYVRTALGDMRISDFAELKEGKATITYDTTNKALAAGAHTLVVKYEGEESLDYREAEIAVTLKALTVTPVWENGKLVLSGVADADKGVLGVSCAISENGADMIRLTDTDGVTAGFYRTDVYSVRKEA